LRGAGFFRYCASMKRILIIEDDKDIVELVRYNLEREGFHVTTAGDGVTGLAQIKKFPPDLLVLDLMLPRLPGLEVFKEIRRDQQLNKLPVLMLTARGEEADRVLGLELGADDYVTKPFSPRELAARVKALLRRMEPPEDTEKPIEVGELFIDPSAYRLTRAGTQIPLSTLEFRLLYFLASRPNKVFSRGQLLDAVWGTERFVTPRSVDVYIRRLREKIEADPEEPVYLKTVRGRLYLRDRCRLGSSGNWDSPTCCCFAPSCWHLIFMPRESCTMTTCARASNSSRRSCAWRKAAPRDWRTSPRYAPGLPGWPGAARVSP